MLPIPIMSTEILVSCAEARQMGAPKTIDANRDRFVVHPGTSRPNAQSRLSRNSIDRVVNTNAATNYARKLRGTLKGSLNVEPLQHRHELGCSVTDDGNATPLFPFHISTARSASSSRRLGPSDVEPHR
jgi:hypothetical protein